jgi:hypothetical protein
MVVGGAAPLPPPTRSAPGNPESSAWPDDALESWHAFITSD